MRAPLLTGHRAPVIPFTVLNGKRRHAAVTGEAQLAELRRLSPDLAAAVDHIVARFLSGEGGAP